MRVMLVELGADRGEYNEPISLGCLASALSNAGIPDMQVDQRWLMVDQRPSLTDLASVDVLGISAQIGSLSRLRDILKTALSLAKPPTIVIGNLLATYAPQELLTEFPTIICVRAEGEFAMMEICRRRHLHNEAARDHLVGVPNVESGSHPRGAGTVTASQRLHELPPPDRQFLDAVRKHGGIARIEGSRGCHWGRCEFCSVSSRFGFEVWRPFPVERIVEELAAMSRLGIRSPYFTDEDFFGHNYDRAVELAEAIIRAKQHNEICHDLNFFISMLASDFRSKACLEALSRLKAAGLREVFVGVEAGSNDQLRRFQKKARIITNDTAVHEARRLGLQIDIGFIFFEPRMTFTDLKLNLAFIRSLPLENCDSRVIKKLRIQPLTAMQTTYAGVIRGPLELDRLTYPYDFEDERVAQCWELFSEWETPLRPAVDRLLASARGEVPDEAHRQRLKTYLAQVRDNDLQALEYMIDTVDAGQADHRLLGEALVGVAERKREIIDTASASA